MSRSEWAARLCARAGWKLPVGWMQAVLSAVLAACMLYAGSAAAQVRYYYDELGRLIEVAAPDGASVQYSYDAAGNITGIRRSAAGAVSLTEFTPNGGPVGTSVTLYGSGFNTTAASNTVLFNGTAAVVSAATATTLNVKVPTGATTGKITVSNASGSAQSASNFLVGTTVPAPTIASFSPQVGTVGTVVTVTGTNFQTNVEDNKAAFNGVFAQVLKDASSPTATQLKASVPNGVPSGKISVTTQYGKVTSAADFYAVPTTINPADVEFKGRITVDATPLAVSIATAGKKAVILFDGKLDQGLHWMTDSGTFTGTVTTQLYRPDGQLQETVTLSNNGVTDFANRLPMPGTYTAILSPASTVKGGFNLRLLSDVVGTLVVDGATAVNLSTGRNARYSFSAEAGKGYGLAAMGLTFTPGGGSLTATLRKADGSFLASCSFLGASNNCDFAPKYFATAGTYLIDFDPSGTYAATFSAVLSKDASGTLTVDAAAATTVTIAREGQNARYTFSGTAGQLVSVVFSGNTLNDGNASTSNYTYVYLYKPSDPSNDIASTSFYTGTAGGTLDMQLPEAGTYTVFVAPAALDKGTIGLQVKSWVSGTLVVDGTTAVNLSTGRNARYSFTAVAGKGYGLAATGLTFTPAGGSMTATLRQANGTYLAQCSFSASNSCDFAPKYFATAGTYFIDFDPSSAYAATFNAVLSKDAGGALTVDAAAATTVTIAREGQNARYTFSGTAGQLMNVVLSGNTLNDGNASTSNYTYVYLYKPSDPNNYFASTYLYTGTAGGTMDIQLPETGTYTVFVTPAALDKGTMGLQLKSWASGTLAVDGATAVNLSTGRNARYSFTAAAGKGYGLAATGLAFTPAGGSMTATLRQANGTYLAQCSFSASNSCDFAPKYFATAGTYLIDFDPSSTYAVTFNAVLSKDAGGTLTVDAAAATTVTIAREGQNARYSFSGTAGQLISILVSGNTLNDGNASTSNPTYVYLYKPSDPNSYFASTYLYTGTVSGTIDVTLPETGTYTVLVAPAALDKGTIGLQVKHR